ncbi:hypothetical protein FHT76_008457 [Rhizobium sp. BK176]|nr:hypothetical protein [Rhizobium sp. BK399]MCS3743915.1 hypothetical protein [Rhizobium sp. BK661]MCS4096734.1 hypothetical protein [Rhizobium sp. BK176]
MIVIMIGTGIGPIEGLAGAAILMMPLTTHAMPDFEGLMSCGFRHVALS